MNRGLFRPKFWWSAVRSRARMVPERLPWLLPKAEPGDWLVFLLGAAIALFCGGWILSKPLTLSLDEIAQLADGTRRKYREFLAPGLWLGAAFDLAAMVALLLVARFWPKGGAARFPGSASEGGTDPSPEPGTRETLSNRRFWAILLVVIAASAVPRWERLDLSYWGDEGWAVVRYGHGIWKPSDRTKPQGEMRFYPSLWEQAFFDDTTGGNHYFFSATQRLALDAWRAITGRPREAFDETISRLPSFFAGLACLPLLAGLLRWWGRPRAGLWAAFFLAAHPMHLRYSSEARGYAIMLCYLLAMIWFAALALQSGRWRWWLFFGLAQLLALYSWKGVYYGVAVTNLAVFLMICFGRVETSGLDGSVRRSRSVTAGRWIMVSLLSGGVFAHLVMPCLLQSPEGMRIAGGVPMNGLWLRQELSHIFTGTPWRIDPHHPSIAATFRLFKQWPVLCGALAAGYAVLLVTGSVALARQCPRLAILCAALILSCILGALHFKYRVHMEWQVWYSYYIIPAICVVVAFGATEIGRQSQRWLPQAGPWIAGLVVVTGTLLTVGPQTRLMIHSPLEANREAFQITRGAHEPMWQSGPSKIFTVYLWRHIALYDPRGDTHCRDAASLKAKIAEVRAADGELYVVMGENLLSRALSGDMVEMLEDTSLFTPVRQFYSQEPPLSLYVFRYTGPR
ncbi:MAG: glycosyltransferase family 39 protein [Akkermansiaceae bacterium]|nr:glycosyltransferase family 39 protein [Akkermansiaceae bacterium]